MHHRTLAVAFGLAGLSAVRSQLTTASILPGNFFDDSGEIQYEGEVLGSGSDGTTYVVFEEGLSPSSSATNTVTVTLVEAATHVSIVAAEEVPGMTATFDYQCDLDTQQNGVCTLIVEQDLDGGETTITSTTSTHMSYAAIPLTVVSPGATSSSASSKASSVASSANTSGPATPTNSTSSSAILQGIASFPALAAIVFHAFLCW